MMKIRQLVFRNGMFYDNFQSISIFLDCIFFSDRVHSELAWDRFLSFGKFSIANTLVSAQLDIIFLAVGCILISCFSSCTCNLSALCKNVAY